NFSSKTSNSATFSSQRVFPGTRTTSDWSELDVAAGGAGTDQSDLTSFVDGRVATTLNFATTFSSTRYVEASFIGSLPAGVTVTTAVGSFTLYETSTTDSSTGTPFTLPWSLATAGDSTVLTTATWATTFSATRYERFTFPPDHVPSAASVTSATLTVAYRSA